MKIIIQSESIRSNEADSGASLKFIILWVTRIGNQKVIAHSESIRGKKRRCSKFEGYYSRRD